jgi:hypothetical protein
MWWFAASHRRAAAKGQTFISCTAPCQKALSTNRTPLHVRGTRRISNVVSYDDPLTCDDASCLARCHRASVSNSCHFFRTPLSIPWRHIQSLRDADRPVRRVPSRDGYPSRSSRIVQHRWEMKDPAAQYVWRHRSWTISITGIGLLVAGGVAVRGASCCRSSTRSRPREVPTGGCVPDRMRLWQSPTN